MLCQQFLPKLWFANVNMTLYCDVANSVYSATMTIMPHCSILKFGRGGIQSNCHPRHHQTSARYWSTAIAWLESITRLESWFLVTRIRLESC